MNRERARTSAEMRSALLQEMGGACVRCGFSDPRALQIDHVNSDGWRHRRKANSFYSLRLSAKKYYEEVRQNPDRYQLLCANCNWIKRHEKDEGPAVSSLSEAGRRGGLARAQRHDPAQLQAWSEQGGRPRKLDAEQAAKLGRLAQDGLGAVEIGLALGISPRSVVRYLARLSAEAPKAEGAALQPEQPKPPTCPWI